MTLLSRPKSILCGLLLAALATPALAQQPTQAQANAIRQSCRSDYQAVCASVPTGGRASLQCLQEHLTDLSPPCRNAVSAATGGAAPSPQAGPAPTSPPTGASPPPPGPPQARPPGAPPAVPLRQEAAVLSRSCGADFRAFCHGVPLGGGRALACLEDNQSRLSPGCRGALAETHGAR